jgi:hypothetical protein
MSLMLRKHSGAPSSWSTSRFSSSTSLYTFASPAPVGSGESSVGASFVPSAAGAVGPVVLYSTVKTSLPLPELPSSLPEP